MDNQMGVGYTYFTFMHEYTHSHTHSVLTLICSLRDSVRISEVPRTEIVAMALQAS